MKRQEGIDSTSSLRRRRAEALSVEKDLIGGLIEGRAGKRRWWGFMKGIIDLVMELLT